MIKKVLTCVIATMTIALTSCYEKTDEPTFPAGNGFMVKLVADEIETGVNSQTRATVPSTDNENKVNSLYLLFFNYSDDKSGTFVETYKVENPVMNSTFPIDFTKNGSALDGSKDYSILALANIEEYTEDVEAFLSEFEGRTEKQVLQNTFVLIDGAGTDEDDDTNAITPDKIVMSTSIVKMAKDAEVTINLKRGVSRFDVTNAVKDGYNLVSVSIWGASSSTALWFDKIVSSAHLKRFYGIKRDVSENEFPDITEGLYAFENFVQNPVQGDESTTCLIIGISPRIDGLIGTPGKVTYYRVNVSAKDVSQNLQRNHVYKVNIVNISALGASSEYEAWTQTKNLMEVTINEWNLDDNGMILTDGVNTMAIPVKRVKLDSKGDSREYSIFTIGTGVLQISRSEIPDGFDIKLDNNLLKVTANALPTGQDKRRGSIELSFAGLRGTIDFIQEPMTDHFLKLNKYSVPAFAPLGRPGISDGPIAVSSSGPWVATIYNTSTDADNPGFSFNPSGAPVTKLTQQDSPFGDQFQIYATGDNPTNATRHGFVLVSLIGHTEYNRVVVLSQRGTTNIKIDPSYTRLEFKSDGTPIGVAGASSSSAFEFNVDPGADNGVTNAWNAVLEGNDKDYFNISVVSFENTHRVSISTKGTHNGYPSVNLLNRRLDDVRVKVYLSDSQGGGDYNVIIPITQEKLELIATYGREIPKTGGKLADDIKLNLPAGLTWTANITENSQANNPYLPHSGYMISNGNPVSGNILANRPAEEGFNVGFDKLLYPVVNVSPVIKIQIEVDQNPDIKTEVTITQKALIPTPVKIMDVRATSYGSLTGGSHWFRYYRDYINSASMYGASGLVNVVKNSPYIYAVRENVEPGKISSDYTYLHAGGRPRYYSTNRHKSVNDWRKANDGIVVYVSDDRERHPFEDPNSSLKELGYTYAAPNNTPKINGSITDKNVMKYLLKDGPFSKGSWLNYTNMSFTMDGISSGLNLSEQAKNRGAIPVITSQNGAVMLMIDPAGQVVYLGEGQFFNGGCISPPVNPGTNSDNSKFLANLLAYILNAAQYGSHFTDHFLPGSTTYPFSLMNQ